MLNSEAQRRDGKRAAGSSDGGARPRVCTRAAFLARAGTALFGTVAAMGLGKPAAGTASAQSGGNAQPLRRRDSKASIIKRWDVVTIGNLSRNRYWGESDDRAVRPAICTCTLITGDTFRLLVDPALGEADRMISELDRRTGLKPRDITAVFITHDHADHVAGIAHFPDARWLAAPDVASILNGLGKLPRRVEGAVSRLWDAIEIIPTPGHTKTHHSARFNCDGLSVVVAGDAVPTRDFFRERRGIFNSVDFELAARTMDKIAGIADVIVPGHDNYFLREHFKALK